MGRKSRYEEAGAVHHMWVRGNHRAAIFRDDRDRRTYLHLLVREIRECGWACLAYCLMDNHVHLVVETPEPNLADGMHRLQGQYARIFNARMMRTGHTFQGRYGSSRLWADGRLAGTLAYVALNPVGAGMCRDPADWPWSSFRAAIDGRKSVLVSADRLAHLFGVKRAELPVRYRNCVAASLATARSQVPRPYPADARVAAVRR